MRTMQVPIHDRRTGIALVMVMFVVVVLGILAGGFAYSMKVETTLARNASSDTELEWIARSGIEKAKYFLANSAVGGQQYDALNQSWAGGYGETNAVLAEIPLENDQLGNGVYTVKISDLDRKFNINLVPQFPEVMRQAMILMGVDAAESPQIVNAIQDWIDPDDDTHLGSTDTESDYYLSLRPGYPAKNGPIDDLSELLLIRGISPSMFYGTGAGAPSRRAVPAQVSRLAAPPEEFGYPVGFNDLFTPISSRFVNINTASATVMQLIPEVDENLAQAIITTRSGPDGAEGTTDDMPFRSMNELSSVPGMTPDVLALLSRYFNVRSTTFEVQIEVSVDKARRIYTAVLRRNGRDVQTLYLYWR